MEYVLPLLLIAVLTPLGLLVLHLTGRLRALPPRPPRPKQPPAALFEVIDRLVLQRPLTRRTVRQITGIALPGQDPGQYFRTFFSDRNTGDLILSAEVRVPSAAGTGQGGMVVLSINTRARITPEAVAARFGRDFALQVPHPEAPFGNTCRYRRPSCDLSFGFTRGSEHLETVVIDAINPHER